jgi:hypothetical protein
MRSPQLGRWGRTDPALHAQLQALKRRPPAGGDLRASPSKQQRKRNKMDRRTRRVSFAPDPELTMVHHFEKVRGWSSARALLDILKRYGLL